MKLLLLWLVLQNTNSTAPSTTPECGDLQKITASASFRTDVSPKAQAERMTAAAKCIAFIEQKTKIRMVRQENEPLALVYLGYIRQACENRLATNSKEFAAICKDLGFALQSQP